MAAGDNVVDAILVNGVSGRRDGFDDVIQKAGAQRQMLGMQMLEHFEHVRGSTCDSMWGRSW